MRETSVYELLERELEGRAIQDYKIFGPISLDDLAEISVWVKFELGDEECYKLRMVK